MPAAYAFFDESGKPHPNNTTPHFVVGMLYCEEADRIAKELAAARRNAHYEAELHFYEAHRIPPSLLTEWLTIWLRDGSGVIAAVADKAGKDITGAHGGCEFQTQAAMMAGLLQLARAHSGKPFVVLADDFDSRTGFRFEQEVKRLAPPQLCVGVLRLRSHANDLIQLADVVTGAVAFQAKHEHAPHPPRGGFAEAKLNIARIVNHHLAARLSAPQRRP
jgi:hypothetical protein